MSWDSAARSAASAIFLAGFSIGDLGQLLGQLRVERPVTAIVGASQVSTSRLNATLELSLYVHLLQLRLL